MDKWLSKHTESLTGKTVAVTGTTGGIGKELCGYLAMLGAKLILCDRNFERSDDFRQELVNKYKADELFDVGEDDVIRPTRKLKDLMPYFLRKDRIAEIQGWIREGENSASDKQG